MTSSFRLLLWFSLTFVATIDSSLVAKPMFDTLEVRTRLELIFQRDQMTRTNSDSVAFRQVIDSQNVRQVLAIIDSLGWLGQSAVGARANQTLWLVIQHADIETQVRYLPLLKKSVDKGESRMIDYAYLLDRVLMRTGKKQMYGTQVISGASGSYEFYQIEDEANVNARRVAIGMEPIEEYAKKFGIVYKAKKGRDDK